MDLLISDFVLDMGLVMDYEMVTQMYVDHVPDWVKHDLTDLIPHAVSGALFEKLEARRIESNLALAARGVGYIGHGHWHVNHDALTYDQAYESFRLCFEIMKSLRLKPVAYAYPRGAGLEEETHRALADAGFLAGRLAYLRPGQSPYIVPDAETTPVNWFSLPVIGMESREFGQCPECINNTKELLPVLDAAVDKTAWIILVYHNIGESKGWAPYRWEDFQGDVRAIAARDFWVAPMNKVVLYLREREKAFVKMDVMESEGRTKRIRLTLSDGLDNDRFDQPLTLIFTPPSDWAGFPVHITQNGRHVGWIYPKTEPVLVSLRPNEEPYLFVPWYPPHSIASRDGLKSRFRYPPPPPPRARQ